MEVIVLYYMSRSGSTFLSKELSSIKGIYILPEFDLFDILLSKKKSFNKKNIYDAVGNDIKLSVQHKKKIIKFINNYQLNSIQNFIIDLSKYLFSVWYVKNDIVKKIILKSNLCSLNTDITYYLDNHFKSISLKRNLVDIFLSQYNSLKLDGKRFNSNVLFFFIGYRYFNLRINNLKNTIHVNYFDLIDNKKNQIKNILSFLSIENVELKKPTIHILTRQKYLHTNLNKRHKNIDKKTVPENLSRQLKYISSLNDKFQLNPALICRMFSEFLVYLLTNPSKIKGVLYKILYAKKNKRHT